MGQTIHSLVDWRFQFSDQGFEPGLGQANGSLVNPQFKSRPDQEHDFFDRGSNPHFGSNTHDRCAELGSKPDLGSNFFNQDAEPDSKPSLGSKANSRPADLGRTPKLAIGPPPGFEASVRSGDLPTVREHPSDQ